MIQNDSIKNIGVLNINNNFNNLFPIGKRKINDTNEHI